MSASGAEEARDFERGAAERGGAPTRREREGSRRQRGGSRGVVRRWIALLLLLAACVGPPKQVEVPKAAAGNQGTVAPEVYAQLAEFFNKKRPLVVTCYNNAITNRKLDAKATGRLGFTMQITPGGIIEHLKVAENTLSSKDVEVCLLKMIQEWVTPAPGQTTEFAYSYEFRPD